MITHAALGPDLYGGTSGVALFLAELHAATGDAGAARTALGAIRHALAHADELPPASSLGLYSGGIGITLACARVGAKLDETELVERAAALLADVLGRGQHGPEFDLMGGRAGAIVGLLALRDALADPHLIEPARELGDELLATAERTGTASSWASPSFPRSPSLTGLSHGAAGVGYALLELFRATGDVRYRAEADRAFEYERALFDPEARNWPDLRDAGGTRRPGHASASFATFWCHGAPGIALSRLRAYEHLADATCREESIAALTTTGRAVAAMLPSRSGNFSLCHGLAGNAEILRHGSAVLGSAWPDGTELADAVAEAGVEAYALPGLPWPCGTLEGETPSLFLGLAGIGLFYLRLRDQRIPSLLLIQPEQFAG